MMNKKKSAEKRCFHRLSMSNSIHLDSIPMSSFSHNNFREIDFLSGGEGDWMKRQNFFLGSGRRSYLVRVFLLEVCDWLKWREEFDLLGNNAGESKTKSVSGKSNSSGSLEDRHFDDLVKRENFRIRFRPWVMTMVNIEVCINVYFNIKHNRWSPFSLKNGSSSKTLASSWDLSHEV